MTRLLYNWFMSHENWYISFCWSAVFDVNNVQSFVSQFVYAVSISIKIVIV